MKKVIDDSFRWNKVANWYDALVGEEGSEFHRFVIFPNLIDLMGGKKEHDLEGKKVVDIACGQGVLCRLLSSLGCETLGIDISPTLVRMAKKRSPSVTNPAYVTADCTKLLSNNGNLKFDLKENYYDYATIVLSIQNISPMAPLLKASNKLLKKGGSLIITMMHPCFRIPQYADWQFNDKEKRQERVIWKYLENTEIKIKQNPSENDSAETIHYHRPLKSYINALANAGFMISKVDELITYKQEQKGVRSEMIMQAKKEFPMFLVIKATKVAD
ncbi:MAG: class I SAM-dependent methyltransferase [Bacilli bacterium]